MTTDQLSKVSPPRRKGPTFVEFERVSHCGELLIVFFYAEAYEEAVKALLKSVTDSGEYVGPLLLAGIFLAVTVRFFMGNFFHLSDPQWEKTWSHAPARMLYYVDFFFVLLESLAMILLGSYNAEHSNAFQLTGTLIVISAVDVLWICVQRVLKRIWVKSSPVQLSWAWLWLNLTTLALQGLVLYGFRAQALNSTILLELGIINWLAFAADIVLTSRMDPWKKENESSVEPEAPCDRREVTKAIHLDDDRYMDLAYGQAKKSYDEGGCPIGAVLVENATGEIVGQGHNGLVQKGDPTLHGEMAALRAAGRTIDRHVTTLYTTLQPCFMCAGAIAQFGIPRVVIGDVKNAPNQETIQFLRLRGVEIVVLDPTSHPSAAACTALVTRFKSEKPSLWSEDWGDGRNPHLPKA